MANGTTRFIQATNVSCKVYLYGECKSRLPFRSVGGKHVGAGGGAVYFARGDFACRRAAMADTGSVCGDLRAESGAAWRVFRKTGTESGGLSNRFLRHTGDGERGSRGFAIRRGQSDQHQAPGRDSVGG